MSGPLILIPDLDLDRVADGDPLAVRDALSAVAGVLQQLTLAITSRTGVWRDEAYAAEKFTTNSTGSWTVTAPMVKRYRYIVIDQLLILDVAIVGSSINNGTTTELRVAVPGGYVASGLNGSRAANFVWSGTTGAAAQAETGAVYMLGQRYVSCQRWDGTAAAGFPQFTDLVMGFVFLGEIQSPRLGT